MHQDMNELTEAGKRLMSLQPREIGRFIRVVRRYPTLVALIDRWGEPKMPRSVDRLTTRPGGLLERNQAERHALAWGLLVHGMEDADPEGYFRIMCSQVGRGAGRRTIAWRAHENRRATLEVLLRPMVEALEDRLGEEVAQLTGDGGGTARPTAVERRRLGSRLQLALEPNNHLALIRFKSVLEVIDRSPGLADLRRRLDAVARRQDAAGEVARYLGPTPVCTSMMDEVDAAGISWAVMRRLVESADDDPWGMLGVWDKLLAERCRRKRKAEADAWVDLIRPLAQYVNRWLREAPIAPSPERSLPLPTPSVAIVVHDGDEAVREVTQEQLEELSESFHGGGGGVPSLLIDETKHPVHAIRLDATPSRSREMRPGPINALWVLVQAGRPMSANEVGRRTGAGGSSAEALARLSGALNLKPRSGRHDFIARYGSGDDNRYAWSPVSGSRFLLIFKVTRQIQS